MCGGNYYRWSTPRHLIEVNGETIVGRTIRLLREAGIEDIAISSNIPSFGGLGVPVLWHENSYRANGSDDISGRWTDAFYPTDEPVCYIFGDVLFSPEAIRTIVETETDSIEFFASAPPFAPEYRKPYAEPFALKVQDQKRLTDAIEKTNAYEAEGRFDRKPIMWELWNVITGSDLNSIDYESYVVINDYTCDIDSPEEIELVKSVL